MFADLYAQALHRAAHTASLQKQEEVLTRLRERLTVRGHEKLLPKIYKAYRRLLEREERRCGAVLLVARAEDEASARSEAAEVFPRDDVDAAIVRIDPTLIGGWRFSKGSQRHDTSYKRSLIDLYHKITA